MNNRIISRTLINGESNIAAVCAVLAFLDFINKFYRRNQSTWMVNLLLINFSSVGALALF
jgi:hypothetical protein